MGASSPKSSSAQVLSIQSQWWPVGTSLCSHTVVEPPAAGMVSLPYQLPPLRHNRLLRSCISVAVGDCSQISSITYKNVSTGLLTCLQQRQGLHPHQSDAEPHWQWECPADPTPPQTHAICQVGCSWGEDPRGGSSGCNPPSSSPWASPIVRVVSSMRGHRFGSIVLKGSVFLQS